MIVDSLSLIFLSRRSASRNRIELSVCEMTVRIESISEAKVMQKTGNPCQAHLESVDNPLIHYFVTLTTAPDNTAWLSFQRAFYDVIIIFFQRKCAVCVCVLTNRFIAINIHFWRNKWRRINDDIFNSWKVTRVCNVILSTKSSASNTELQKFRYRIIFHTQLSDQIILHLDVYIRIQS